MEARKLQNISLSEYLKIEADAQIKYEFHNGSIYALAGGTLNHGLICGNIFGELRATLKTDKSLCQAMTSEVKLHIESENSYVYPDAMVICNEIETANKNPHAVTNPTVIVEVLSKSTASYDRGDKFFLYRQISSLQEYILIEQDKPQIEIYRREADLWSISRLTGLESTLNIRSLNLEIAFKDIYSNITF